MKNVKNVKNSLKFKAQPKAGVLSVRVGVKKYAVPVEARLISNGEFVFLSFSGVSELFRVKNKELTAMGPSEDATEAYAALNPGRKRGGRRKAQSAEMPAQLAEALKAIPSGFKLAYDATGTLRMVKKRTRKTKKA